MIWSGKSRGQASLGSKELLPSLKSSTVDPTGVPLHVPVDHCPELMVFITSSVLKYLSSFYLFLY
jgi:hypothetical protein